MKHKGRVSVVLVTYNHEPFVETALESILSQNYSAHQIVIVDDGSTDRTYDVVKSFESPKVLSVQRKNGGPSRAFNDGFALSTGDVIVLLSGDDFLTPGSLKMRVEALSGGYDLVCSLANWIGYDGEDLGGRHPNLFRSFHRTSPTDMFRRLYYEGNFICAPSVAMTRACLTATGQLAPDLWQLQDYEYWLRASALGMKFKCLDTPCVNYRWHGQNLSVSQPERSRMELDSVLMNAPRFAGRELLAELVFGKELAKHQTRLTDEDFSVLIRCRHGIKSVSDNAYAELQNALEFPETKLRLNKYIF
jgi:glycosyltransferase involved in cell wall biosynthesis